MVGSIIKIIIKFKKTMKNLYIKGLVKKTAENSYRVIASTDSIDRQGDVIDQTGWLTDNYMKNPVMLWAHDYSELPVAKCIKLSVDASIGLICDFEFASAEANPKAGQIKMLYDEGFMNAVSVGFIPKEQNGNIITKAELLEISFVPVPANQDALRLAMSKGLDISLVEKDISNEITPETKGEVADELNAEEMYEQKCEKWEEIMEAVSAFWSVYFDEATPVEDFVKLLEETIGLLQEVADTDGIDEDDIEDGEKGIVATAKSIESKTKFTSAISEKAGREISSANHDKIKSAHEFTSKALAVLEELKTSAQNGDEKSIEEKVVVEKPKEAGMTEEELKSIQATIRIGKQNNEFALKIINDFLSKKSAIIR